MKKRVELLPDGYAKGMTMDEIIAYEEAIGMFERPNRWHKELGVDDWYTKPAVHDKRYYDSKATCLVNGLAGTSKNGKKYQSLFDGSWD